MHLETGVDHLPRDDVDRGGGLLVSLVLLVVQTKTDLS